MCRLPHARSHESRRRVRQQAGARCARQPRPEQPSVPSARDAGETLPSADTRPPANRSAPRGW